LLLLLPSLPAFCSRRLLFDCCFAIALAITFVFIGFLLLPAAKSAAAPTLHPPATVQFDCCFLIRLIGVFQSLCCCFRGYLAFSVMAFYHGFTGNPTDGQHWSPARALQYKS
jgi:hypothetical protein